MFEPSKLLQKYLNDTPRDMYDIVGALIGYLNADPWFETNDFEEAIDYVLSRGVSENDLFSSFDPDVDYESDQTKWDEEYYSFARVYLKDNFCRKRIDHVREVAHKIHPKSTLRSNEKNIGASTTPKAPTSTSENNVRSGQASNEKSVNVMSPGGQQSPGKKQIDHRKNHTEDMTTRRSVGILPVISILGVIILVVVIVIIINS